MTFRRIASRSLGMALAVVAAACSSHSSEAAAGAATTPSDTTSAGSGGATPTDTTHTAVADATPASGATTGAHQADSGATSGAVAAAPDTSWVTYDAATKTVTFRLVAGPFSFNGFTNGGATLTVPPASSNVWNFVQDDGTPHSAEVAAGSGPIPNSGGNPAIPRAYTNKVVEGLAQGAKDVIRFTAPDTGTYRIICGVPGHALGGMWLWFKVDPAAKAPAFGK